MEFNFMEIKAVFSKNTFSKDMFSRGQMIRISKLMFNIRTFEEILFLVMFRKVSQVRRSKFRPLKDDKKLAAQVSRIEKLLST